METATVRGSTFASIYVGNMVIEQQDMNLNGFHFRIRLYIHRPCNVFTLYLPRAHLSVNNLFCKVLRIVMLSRQARLRKHRRVAA
jgi:hypothetical protein